MHVCDVIPVHGLDTIIQELVMVFHKVFFQTLAAEMLEDLR